MTNTEHGKNHRHSLTAWNVAVIAILAATALGGNYLLMGIPNVEFSSVMVFLSGFIFGPMVGVFVGLIAMTVYQIWNPWGGFLLPIGLAVIGSTVLIGFIGGLAGKDVQEINTSGARSFMGPALLGMMWTLFFDLVTNYAYSITFGIPYIVALGVGLPFSILHIFSNGVLFALLTPSVTRVIQHLQLGPKQQPQKSAKG